MSEHIRHQKKTTFWHFSSLQIAAIGQEVLQNYYDF
jgi:hypothetical protein